MGRMTSHVWNHQPAIVFDIHLQLDGIVTYNRGAHLAGYIYNWSFLAIRQRFRIIRIKKFLKINKFLTHIILCFFPFKHHLRWGKNLKQHMKKGVENPTKLGKIRPPETQFPPAVLTKLLRLCSDKPGPRLVDQWMFSNIKQLDLYTCLC
jgi:hypothetical protein